jgi:hypothetical protein
MLTRIACWTGFVLIVTVVCGACSSASGPVSGSSANEQTCRVHHVPLVTVDAFGPPDRVIVDPGIVEVDAVKRYPNFIPSGISLRRTVDYPIPRKVTYCPKCEEAVKAIPNLHRI